MKFIPKLWAERADQKHVNNSSRLVSAPGANYYDGCQTSNVWRRKMSRSRESRPRGSRKQQTETTYAARPWTLNRLKKIIDHGAQGFALLAHSLLVMYRSFNSGAYREILKVYAWEVNFHPENCLIYGLGNAISCVFCRIFKENHEYDENAVVGCLFQPSLVSSTKLTPLIKKVTSKWWDV